MNSVKRVLNDKAGGVWSVAPETNVRDALALMAEKDIGAVMVVAGGRLVGIFTERDYVRRVVLQDRDAAQTGVGDVMTTRILFVRPDQTIEECMALMTDRHLRHLPVLDGDALVGVVSIRDAVRYVVDEKEFMIEQLTNYITDRNGAS